MAPIRALIWDYKLEYVLESANAGYSGWRVGHLGGLTSPFLEMGGGGHGRH